MKLYIYTTKDRYELPIMVCDSVSELAGMVGVRPHSILEAISREKHGKLNYKNRFAEVEVTPEGMCFCGSILRRLRRELGITMSELAELMEVTPCAVWNWEHGRAINNI